MTFRLMGPFVSLSLALAGTAQAQPAPVKNIVLVHGAWADGSGWRGVSDILTERGFAVSIVQNPLTGLAEDVAATERVLARQDGPAILVGHSYGGIVITEAGKAENVAGLVYVAAFVPDAGESLLGMIEGGGPPPVQPSKDGFLFFDPTVFAGAFAQDLPPADAAFLAVSQVPVAAAAFEAKVSEPAWKTRPAWHVIATDDHIIPPDAQRKWAGRAGSTIIEAPGSHAVYVSQPKAVADAIETAAKAAAK
jgi:pimeloyl-ACP methyl ester carboxylesterase